MKQKTDKIIKVILILCVLGFLTSLYLVKNHYADPSSGSLCDFGETVSCSLVNTSTYSELFNVPVALLGAIWFFFLFIIAKSYDKKKPELAQLMLTWCSFGMLFVVYMIVAEIILKAICPFCTIVHIITLIIFGLSLRIVDIKNFSSGLKKTTPWIFGIIVISLIPFIIFNVGQGEKENYDEFAKCITEKGVNMYGSFRCGICAKTRNMFGDSFQYISEIECHPQGENSQLDLCLDKAIEGTPTWILEPAFFEEKRYTGFLSIEELEDFSGCEYGSS